MHLGAIKRFSKLKERKLESIRLVNKHLQEGRAKRLIAVLRTNLSQIKTKENNLRQACQFHLFRRPVFIKRAGFNALKYHRERQFK